jgi:PIN domain nuclease of toxin-antitoxin system
MRFLLDTSVFLCSLDRFEQLSEHAQQVLRGKQEIYLSAASSWEIVIKWGLGKLKLPKGPQLLIPEAMTRFAVHPLPITQVHTLAVAGLPVHHKDPFDRMLLAQSQSERMTLMTANFDIRKYPVEILWCGK